MHKTEETLRKSLAIEERLERLEGMANDYGNLGLICKGRGNVATGREYLTKARNVFERVGVPRAVVSWLPEFGVC